jgi:pilus assembly protein CpaE
LSDETGQAVEAAVADRRLARAKLNLRGGGIPAAVEHYADTPTPEILVVETTESGGELMAALDALAGICQPTTKVIILGARNDVALYRMLRRQGISEYLPTPLQSKHLSETLVALSSSEVEANAGKLISFIGAGGGVGSSQVAHNAAFHLARIFDAETAVLDFDLGFGTVGLDFNVESPQNMGSVLADPDRIDPSMLQRLMAKHGENLYLLTAPSGLDKAGEVAPVAAETLLTSVRRTAAFVVADLPCVWLPWVQHVLDLSDEIVVTAAPRLHSLRHAKQIIDWVTPKRPNDAPVRVLLNRVGAHPKTELSTRDFVSALGRAPTMVLPNDPAVFEAAANDGAIIGDGIRSPKLVELFEELTLLLGGRKPAVKRRGGLAELLGFPLLKRAKQPRAA